MTDDDPKPAKPLVPNRQTIEAIKAARRGEVTTAGHPRQLLKKLNADIDDPRPAIGPELTNGPFL